MSKKYVECPRCNYIFKPTGHIYEENKAYIYSGCPKCGFTGYLRILVDETVLVQILHQIKETFDKYNIEYWLDMGTLLGAVRNEKIIPWDTDIDLGSWKTEINKIVHACNELYSIGFDIYYGKTGVTLRKADFNLPIQITTYDKTTNIKEWLIPNNLVGKFVLWVLLPSLEGYLPNMIHIINLYGALKFSLNFSLHKFSHALPTIYRERIIRFIKLFSIKIGCCKYIQSIVPQNYFNHLSGIKFYGMTFSIPSSPKKYLEIIYGENWLIPKRDYVYHKDMSTILQEIKVKK